MFHPCRVGIAACLLFSTPDMAATALPSHPAAEAQALDLAEQSIRLRSVHGPGDQTPEVAALYRQALILARRPRL